MPKYGLCGKSLVHSYSEIIHKKLGNDEYKLINLTKEEFYDFMKLREFCAVNVTIPYKTDAFSLCDEVSDEAKSIGSVNTVVNCGGRLFGYNTDIFGFLHMTNTAGISLCGKKVLILGTGGTSLTAHAACEKEKAAEVVTVSRSGSVNYENVYVHNNAEIIINTTPVGMYPNNGETPIDLSNFPKLCGVVDVIYNPSKTRFLQDAKALGIPTAGGLSMLVAQAVRADEYFFSRKREDMSEIIERITDECERLTMNVLLIGMPGCGKTTVGKILSERSGREFFDTDAVIEERAGEKISDIIPEKGEEYFRNLETDAISDISKLSGKIISVGGGAVLRPENRRLMKQNSLCVYIKRDLLKLPTNGRPLSSGGGSVIEALFEKRKPLYEETADFEIDINEEPEKCAQIIFEKYLKGI